MNCTLFGITTCQMLNLNHPYRLDKFGHNFQILCEIFSSFFFNILTMNDSSISESYSFSSSVLASRKSVTSVS